MASCQKAHQLVAPCVSQPENRCRHFVPLMVILRQTAAELVGSYADLACFMHYVFRYQCVAVAEWP